MKELVCKVCGMMINEKNYSINKEALLNLNSKEEVLVCPFCGAPIEYLDSNIEQIYSIEKNELDDKTITILDHAMKLEVFNGDFYKVAADMAEEVENKKLFEGLSRIEYVHARVHQKLGGFDRLPVLNKLDYKKYNTDRELLDLAESREQHAVQYYSKYMDEVSSDIIKQVFKAFKCVENDHIDLVER